MAKRAIGEGSVRQPPNGLWEARLSYIDPASGRRRSASFYADTAEAVRDKLDEARDRIKAEVPVQDSSQRLSEWVEHWSATTLEASPRKPVTKRQYRSLARKHLCPAPFGATPLDKLRKSHIDGLLVRLRGNGLSDSTVRLVYTILRAILNDAQLDGLIAGNPANRVPRPRVARREARYLDADQVAAILSCVEGSRHHPVLVLIAATGLRRGEALALRWEHINFTDRSLRVAGTLSRVGEQLVITEPKTARSRRTVPLSPAVVSMLRSHKAAQAAERLHAGSEWTDSGLVFTDEAGGPVEPGAVLASIMAAAKKAGITDVGVHTLRHSAAVAWLEAGVHIKAVADLLGHSSISITGDIYGHTSDATTRAAVEGLSGALGL
jgi:integrase